MIKDDDGPLNQIYKPQNPNIYIYYIYLIIGIYICFIIYINISIYINHHIFPSFPLLVPQDLLSQSVPLLSSFLEVPQRRLKRR